MIFNLMEALFGFGWRKREPQPSVKTDLPPRNKELPIVPLQYKDDVKRLKTYVGEANWKPGLELKLELKELLAICPRERKRSDSYRKLIGYLDEELNIKLTIKSRRKEDE